MRVIETEKTANCGQNSNYKRISEKYFYNYVAGITTDNAGRTEDSGPSQSSLPRKAASTQTAGKDIFYCQSLSKKSYWDHCINQFTHDVDKNIIYCPRCIFSKKGFCDHCKKQFSHDVDISISKTSISKTSIENAPKQKLAIEIDSEKNLKTLYKMSDHKLTTTPNERSRVTVTTEDELEKYEKLLQIKVKKTSSTRITGSVDKVPLSLKVKLQQTQEEKKAKKLPGQEEKRIPHLMKKHKSDEEIQKFPKEIKGSAEEKKKPPKGTKKSDQELKKPDLDPTSKVKKQKEDKNDNKTAEDKKKSGKKSEKKTSETIKVTQIAKLLKTQAAAVKKEKLEREKQRKAMLEKQKTVELTMEKLKAKAKELSQILKTSRPKAAVPETNSSSTLICDVQKPKINQIIGEHVLKYKPGLLIPLKLDQAEPPKPVQPPEPEQSVEKLEKPKLTEHPKIIKETVEAKKPKGGIVYALSDRKYIENGWTVLPYEKILRKIYVYRMYPSHPEFDWFEQNKKRCLIKYNTGEKLAQFEDDGRCRIYYKSGRLALDYYAAEEANAKQRFIVYSNGKPNERGCPRPVTVLAVFDYIGNGIVYDHAGKVRLKYNQNEGVVMDSGIGPKSNWQWHSLNDPPNLHRVLIDSRLTRKDPVILQFDDPTADSGNNPDSDPDPEQDPNSDMIAIELQNFIKEKQEKAKKITQGFKPYQIKMKALKINENFSLKVLDQKSIHLIFRDSLVNIKLNVGMILDHREIIDIEFAELGVISNSVERYPAVTDSIAAVQRTIEYARRYEKKRTDRELFLRPQVPADSADRLVVGLSRPLRPPLTTILPSQTLSSNRTSRLPLRPQSIPQTLSCSNVDYWKCSRNSF